MSELAAHRPEPAGIVVVGAGIVGLAVAWRLAAAGERVTVIDRGSAGRATSWVAAGMLAPVFEADPAERGLARLLHAAAERWPEFASELGGGAAIHRTGTLAVARDTDETESLERELELRRSLGLAETVSWLPPRAARQLEPGLAPRIRGALRIDADHAVDPRAVTGALAAAVRRRGSVIRERTEVLSVQESAAGEGPLLVCLRGGAPLEAEHVVIAAGPWSSAIAGLPAAEGVPLRPVKGQSVRLRDPSGPGLIGRVLRMREGYLVPRPDGRYVLGASSEERGFEQAPTAGVVHALLRDAIELVPGLAQLELEEIPVGLRPGTPDNRPVIGPGTASRLHWATGHYRHGVLLAPLTAELVLAGLRGTPGDPEVAELVAPGRFAAGPVTVGANARARSPR